VEGGKERWMSDGMAVEERGKPSKTDLDGRGGEEGDEGHHVQLACLLFVVV
jgi:hypothetical protein